MADTRPRLRVEEFEGDSAEGEKTIEIKYVEKHAGCLYTVTVVPGDRINPKGSKGSPAIRRVVEVLGEDRSEEPPLPMGKGD